MILRGSVHSQVLEMETSITLITPETRPSWIVYLLHGLQSNSSSWLDLTRLPLIARSYNALFIMPEVGRSFYSDMTHGGKYFTYVADELPKLCERTFGVILPRSRRAVMGASMGGHGALKIALARPKRFAFCAGFASSPVYLNKELIDDPDLLERLFGERIVADLRAVMGNDMGQTDVMDIFALARENASSPERPEIYLTCGTQDDVCAENAKAAEDLRALGYSATFEQWQGAHNWAFFEESLVKALGKMLETKGRPI